ncbi:hypothetical protein EF384_07500 [Aerococcus agrisoli]|uniref:Uncharacterized protein n=1 Tax=Aerococcus agrisoli TaxID=2487350 RepID=A0A3N4G808_9LACT|nr:hypothetical protein EF384_07500 [Aerococcus agrisoli]
MFVSPDCTYLILNKLKVKLTAYSGFQNEKKRIAKVAVIFKLGKANRRAFCDFQNEKKGVTKSAAIATFWSYDTNICNIAKTA